MCHFPAILCSILVWLLATPLHAAYQQLLSSRYTDLSRLPADSQKPVPTYDFVRRDQLPASQKVQSAARAASGVVWVVTDRGAFRSDKAGYVPLEDGPRHRRPGQRE